MKQNKRLSFIPTTDGDNNFDVNILPTSLFYVTLPYFFTSFLLLAALRRDGRLPTAWHSLISCSVRDQQRPSKVHTTVREGIIYPSSHLPTNNGSSYQQQPGRRKYCSPLFSPKPATGFEFRWMLCGLLADFLRFACMFVLLLVGSLRGAAQGARSEQEEAKNGTSSHHESPFVPSESSERLLVVGCE